MEEKPSAIDHLLESVASAVLARTASLNERIRRVELCLESYRRAAYSHVAREFAREHGFKQPAPEALPVARAAVLLRDAVLALPELADSESVPTSQAPQEFAAEEPPSAPRELSRADYPLLTLASERGKIAVIGALSGRDRASTLPAALAEQVEWIDTEREGTHAIGNLPQRVRQGRVAAIIILERAVQHRHTEPVMAAAREAAVPVAFAGQGGKASLLRAFAQLETALGRDAPAAEP